MISVIIYELGALELQRTLVRFSFGREVTKALGGGWVQLNAEWGQGDLALPERG